MNIPRFAEFFEAGLSTPFKNFSLVLLLVVPYLIIINLSVKSPNILVQNYLLIGLALILYKTFIYALTYRIHTESNFSEPHLPALFDTIWNVFATAIVTILILLIGYALFIIPGIYLTARLVLAVPLASLYGQSALQNITESYKKTEGKTKQIFGLFVEIGLISLFVFASFVAASLLRFDFEIFSWILVLIIITIGAIIELGTQSAFIEILFE